MTSDAVVLQDCALSESCAPWDYGWFSWVLAVLFLVVLPVALYVGLRVVGSVEDDRE